MSINTVRALTLSFVLLLLTSTSYGAKQTCSSILSEGGSSTKVVATAIKPSSVRMTLSDLALLDSSNPAIAHPALVMTAAQKYQQLVTMASPVTVKDPVFRAKDIQVFPAFTAQLGLNSKSMIIGQYAAVEALTAHIASAARGEKGGKIFGAIGPSGTGKTELFYVLDTIRTELSKTSPQFFEFTFKWRDLHKVPALAGLVPTMGGNVGFVEIDPDIKRSPFTLLRSDMQTAVLAAIETDVEAVTGFPLQAWTHTAPKDREIIEQIMINKYPKVASGELTVEDLSETQYLKALEDHVRIVPRERGRNGTSELIRALGSNPNFQKLFVEQNPIRMMVYPQDSPLSWDYTGKIVQQDGGALILDEAPRNEKEVLDAMLEVAQNSVAEADGPAVMLDVIGMYTGNDESIESAKEDGDLNAFLDRSHTVPMRLNLHPWEVAKTALLMVGASKFKMRKLGTGKVEALEPLELNKVYPLPDKDGNLLGLHRRYAIYYNYDSREEPILVSPHTLEMLALTASITRLVTDQKKFNKFGGEFEKLTPQHQYFVNPVARLKMILGKDSVNGALRTELAKLSSLLHEGESGISARDVQSWFKQALEMAIKAGHGVLTPEMMDLAFKKLIDEGTIKITSTNLRAEWLQRYSLVKSAFTLPDLHKDIQEIVAGHGQRAERLYDVVIGEVIELAENANAETWQPDDGSGTQVINQKRFESIKDHYKKIHNKAFSPFFLMRHLSTAAKGERNPELLAAIEAHLTDTQLDIADTAKAMISFLKGENTNPDVQKKASEIEGKLIHYGYDESSFMAALQYWSILQGEEAKAAKKQK